MYIVVKQTQLLRLSALIVLRAFLIFFLPASSQAQTVFPIDQKWSNELGWQTYWNIKLTGCIAETRQVDDTVFLLGVTRKEKNLFVGFSSNRIGFAKNNESYKLKLQFDGNRNWDVEIIGLETLGKKVLFGTFKNASELRNELSRSNNLRIFRAKSLLAEVLLKGTSAIFKVLESCHNDLHENFAKKNPTQTVSEVDLAKSEQLTFDALQLLKMGKFDAAEPLFRQALAIREKSLGKIHYLVGDSLNNLALLLNTRGDNASAEPLYRRPCHLLY